MTNVCRLRLFLPLLVGVFLATAAHADIASVSFIHRKISEEFRLDVPNTAQNPTNIADISYLMRTIDSANEILSGSATNYSDNVIAGNRICSTSAAIFAVKNLISVPIYNPNGILLSFGDDNADGWTIAGSPAADDSGMVFNGIDQYARSANALNVSAFSALTIEIRFKLLSAAAVGILFELTSNWNSNIGGVGVAINLDGSVYSANTIHTVHNISSSGAGANNYSLNLNNLQSHTLVNTFSTITNPAGRLLYYDGKLVAASGSYTTGTAINGPLKNDYLYLASRGGSSFLPVVIQSVRIYNRQLSAAEVCANTWLDYYNFGGARPDCTKVKPAHVL